MHFALFNVREVANPIGRNSADDGWQQATFESEFMYRLLVNAPIVELLPPVAFTLGHVDVP